MNLIKKSKKEKKGITLIALVITIVVLLILGGITINLLLSNGGIIKKAQQAKNKMDIAMKDDELLLNPIIQGKTIDELVNGDIPKLKCLKVNQGIYLYLTNSIFDYILEKPTDEIEYTIAQKNGFSDFDKFIQSFDIPTIRNKNDYIKYVNDMYGEENYKMSLLELISVSEIKEEYQAYANKFGIQDEEVTIIDPKGVEHKISNCKNFNFYYSIPESGKYKFTVITEDGKRAEQTFDIQLKNIFRLVCYNDMYYKDEDNNDILLFEKHQVIGTFEFERGQTWKEFIGNGIDLNGLRIEKREDSEYLSVYYDGKELINKFGFYINKTNIENKIVEEGEYALGCISQ